MLSIYDLFKGRHFDQQMVRPCACWYLWFKLNFRGSPAHTTTIRRIQRYVPEFKKHRTCFAFRASSSWRALTYLHRSAEEGKTVDFPLRCRRCQSFLPAGVHELDAALMLGFKRFRHASITMSGVEFMHRIGKGQFQLGKLRIKDNKTPEIWNEALAA
jgi:IS6 family transposase